MVLRRKSIISFFFMFFVLFILTSFFARAEWSDCIDIEIESSIEIPENYSHKIELNPGIMNYSKAKDDGSDIRFYGGTCADPEEKLFYWVENWNVYGISVVWFKTENPNPTSIALFYGDPEMIDESDIRNTFLFGDDFEDYENGDLNGQNGWSGDIHFDIGENNAYSGNKSVEIIFNNDLHDIYIQNFFKSTENIKGTMYLYASGNNARPGVMFNENALPLQTWGEIYVLDACAIPNVIVAPSLISRTPFDKNSWYKINFTSTKEHANITIVNTENLNNDFIENEEIYNIVNYFDLILLGHGGCNPQSGEEYIDLIYIGKYISPEPTYSFDVEKEIPDPTEDSLIIAGGEWQNFVAATPARLPVIYADSLTPEVIDFLEEYMPDHIYTIGTSFDLENSYEITIDDMSLFFPNATKAIYASSREKAMVASAVAYYMGVPLVFENSGYPEIIDLESKTIQEIQEYYLNLLYSNGDNTYYIVLANPEDETSLLAGYLAGLKKGYIIFAEDLTYEDIMDDIKQGMDVLSSYEFFQDSIMYKMGNPLFLAILGGNESIPFLVFNDMAFEILDDKDGTQIYSDTFYGDVNDDNYIDLALGRLNGDLTSVSLQLARQRLPRNNVSTTIGEYRHGMFFDLFNLGGGMMSALAADAMLEKVGFENTRIVEKRRNEILTTGDVNEMLGVVTGLINVLNTVVENAPSFLGVIGLLWKILNIEVQTMYVLMEFDWAGWNWDFMTVPDHLQVVDADMDSQVSGSSILGYFGLGDEYWVIPEEERSKLELMLDPYGGASDLENLEFSGFLYSDHDISAESEITEQVLSHGGGVYASSGIVHDPYAVLSSMEFFARLAYSEPFGEAARNVYNSNPAKHLLTFALIKSLPLGFDNGLYLKNRLERMLFSEPSCVPVEDGLKKKGNSYSVNPSNSFGITDTTVSNYSIDEGRLTVHNAGTYLMEDDRPMVPVLLESYILPTGSSVKYVDVKPRYSVKFIPQRDIISRDSHYINETAVLLDCFSSLGIDPESEMDSNDEASMEDCILEEITPEINYPYPENEFWYKTELLLDGRIAVHVFVPAAISMNDRLSRVLENAEITIDYESPLEMSLISEDIVFGEEENITIEFMNEGGELSGDLLVFAKGPDDWNFSEHIDIPANGSILRNFIINPPKGDYEIIVLFVSEEITIGPRYGEFEVGDVDFEARKEFRPERVKLLKNHLVPGINMPQITIENTGHSEINYVRIMDEIPEGFSLMKDYVFVVVQKGRWFFPWLMKSLRRKYYDVEVVENQLIVEIPDMESSNYGSFLEENEKITIMYMMKSENGVYEEGEIETNTVVEVMDESGFSGAKDVSAVLRII